MIIPGTMLAVCNIMTMSGFDKSVGGSGTMAWAGVAIIFFLILFSRRWVFEEFDIPFNAIFAYIIGLGVYLIVVSLSCSPKWSLLAGLGGALVGGIGLSFLGIDIGGGGE